MAWHAGNLDFRLTRDAEWAETLRYLNADRTPVLMDADTIAHIQLRTMATRDGLDPSGLVLELSSDIIEHPARDYAISLNILTGEIAWVVPRAAVTALNPLNTRTVRYAYSLRLMGEMFGDVRPLLYGTVVVDPEVIR